MKRRAWMRRLDGWLLIVGGLAMGLTLWLAPAAGASSRDSETQARRDFNSLVRTVAARYHMHPKPVPMMWIANLCARSITHGGVSGMKVVEFEDADRIAQAGGKPAEFSQLMKTQLGDRWSPLIREHEKSSGDSYVYVQSSDESKLTRMIVVDLDGAELDLVSINLNPDQLAKWMKEHDSDSDKKNSSAEPSNSE